MQAGLQHHGGGTGHGLGGQLNRLFLGQTFRQTTIRQGFNESVNVSRAAAAQPGHGIQQRFSHASDGSNGTQQAFGGSRIRSRGRGAAGIGGGTLTDQRRSVRHDPDHPVVPGRRFHGFECDPGGDGDEQPAFLHGLQGSDQRHDARRLHA